LTSKNGKVLEKFKEEWVITYTKSLREKIVGLCNIQQLDPTITAIAHSLECSTKDIVVQCLRQIADDIEKNTLIIR